MGHPVAFASRKLSGAERNYPTYTNENFLRLFTLCASGDRTCMAAGSLSKRTTTPLRYLDTQTNLSKRQMSWMETPQEYDYSIEYVRGKYNAVADALSRMADAPSPVLYAGEDEEDDSRVVSVNVLGTVRRPMLTRNMMKDLKQAYEEDPRTFIKFTPNMC
jgi:RNase H-like domain found in reverse transcriptase